MSQTERLYEIFLASQGVTTDTRKCEQGMMFFALKGASFDGNTFARQALEAGCVCAVVDDEAVAGDERIVLVPDVLTALQELAALHRQRMGEGGLRVLQITGTNGKTTTKELCAAVLARKYRVLYTEGNLNNHIGVPLTLLRLRGDHQVAVVETGANHPGEIAALTRIVQPDMGLITNVGRAHLEGFGGFEGVKRTKGELYDWLGAHERPAFVDLGSDDLSEMAMEREGMTVVPYRPGEAVANGEPTMTVRLCGHAGTGDVTIATHLVGDYNAVNVRAAATVGEFFGVADEEIAAAISGYTPSNNRSQLLATDRNTLIVDAYNANPSSMALAVANFAALPGEHKMMILGDMRELGKESEDEHRRVLELALEAGCEQVWLVGSEFARVADGVAGSRCRVFADALAVAAECRGLRGMMILIKGSNGTRLWQLPESL